MYSCITITCMLDHPWIACTNEIQVLYIVCAQHMHMFLYLFTVCFCTSSVGYWLDQSSPVRTQARETGVLTTGMYVHVQYVSKNGLFSGLLFYWKGSWTGPERVLNGTLTGYEWDVNVAETRDPVPIFLPVVHTVHVCVLVNCLQLLYTVHSLMKSFKHMSIKWL